MSHRGELDDTLRARLDRLLVEILDAPAAERSARLAAIGDPSLRAEVEQLLADALDEDWILQPGAGLRPELVLADDEIEPAGGRVFGAYRLLEPIGRGGMGTVYRAERADGRFTRRVAVKVLRLDGPVADRRRFDREQQILAGLDHPGIARLYDGGVSAEGDPYFVMEYVDGEPIDRYCEGHGLDLRRRLELLVEVCAAVEAAHRQLIVHRDLKPSNLLIDRDGRPRLLDFGIAGVADAARRRDVAAASTVREPPTATLGDRRLTLDYASPEQLRGERATIASDVYQLGVLAYELATGRHPHDRPAIEPGASMADAARHLAHPPTPPSRSLALPARRPRLAVADFDAVVFRALAFSPDDRYSTVHELREDLGRVLAGRPVEARPTSAAYRLRRVVGRHPAVAVAGLAAALLVVTLVSAFTWRLAEERDATREQARRAEASLRFVTDLVRQAGPERGSGPETTVRELLDHGARTIRGRFDDHPLLEARLLSEIGSMYEVLGLWDEAEPLLREGLALRRRLGSPEVADSWFRLGRLAANRGRLDEAATRLERALDRATDEAVLAPTLGTLGSVRRRQDRLDEAAALHRRALSLYDARGDHRAVLGEIVNLATVEIRRGRRQEARRLLEGAIEGLEGLVGPEHVSLATALVNLATLDAREGEPRRALPLLTHAVETFEAAYGPRHPKVAETLVNLGNVHSRLDRHDEAREILRRALDLYRSAAADPGRLGLVWINLGVVEQRSGRLGAAESAYRRALELLGPAAGDRDIGLALYNLGEVVLDRGRLDEAEAVLVESRDRLAAALGDDHLLVSFPMLELGRLYVERGDRRRAGEHFERAVAIRRGAEGVDPARLSEAVEALDAWRGGGSR